MRLLSFQGNSDLWTDYLYVGLIGGILGVSGRSVNGNADTETDTDADMLTEQNAESTVQSPVERGILLAEQQYYEIVEQMEQSEGQQAAEDVSPYAGLELMDQEELAAMYMADEMSEEDFLAWYRDPKNYRPELPGTNRSHKYE